MSEKFAIREIVIAEDAEKLATMWKASDDQWPGTWSGGTDITPQMVTEWYERQGMLNVHVVETEDGSKIVGYCSFNERPEKKGVGYIDLLNVQPDYQKKSLARRLLQNGVQRCLDLGFHLLTLGTWSGNLKAMPLYKKVGFCWVPDTSVWMLNFIPAILTLPCAQPFFSRHDWYRTYKRELKQVEDDERWEGMKVFTYHFQEDGEALTVWGDRESWRITAVETDAFFAGAIADNIEPPKGIATELRWRFTNKRSEPVPISLIGSGAEHVKLDYRKTLTVDAGETVELSAPVDISLDTPAVKGNQPVPALRTIFIIDGEVLELGTGLRPQPAVAVSMHPEYVTLSPGVAKKVSLQLKSYLREETTATVTVTPAPGLSVDWTSREVAVPAKSWAGAEITLNAQLGGVYPLYVTVGFGEGATKPERLAIFCMPPGGVLVDLGEKAARLENCETRLLARKHGGEVAIHAVTEHRFLGNLRESLGPPFYPSEFSEKDFDIALSPAADGTAIVLEAGSETYPGLVLQRTVKLGGGNLIELETDFVNQGNEAHKLQLDRFVWPGTKERATMALPLKQGIVRERMSEYPAAEEDVPKLPDGFAERWVCIESSHGTLGAIWDKDMAETEFSWGLGFLTPQIECKPLRWTRGGRLTLYAGHGSWQAVRELSRRMAGQDEPEPIPATVRKIYGARLEPAPLVTVDDTVSADVVIDNLRGRPMEGRARLSVPEGVTVDRDDFAVSGVTIGNAMREPVTVQVPAQAAAYRAEFELESRIFRERLATPIIRLGDRGPVAVTQGELCTIDNGRTQFAIAPEFGGAMTQWKVDGVNQLLTPYPEQATFGWMSPWYGGITPVVAVVGREDFPGKLDQETLTAKSVAVTDDRGVPWHGVRLCSDLEREKLLGLSVELAYLTTGSSNVLKLVARVHNHTTAARTLTVGWISFWRLGGDPQLNVLHAAGMQRRPNPWYSRPRTGHWAAVTNLETQRTAILISPYPEAVGTDWGEPGNHLAWLSGVTVRPEATLTRTVFLALCQSLDEAKLYVPLKDYQV